MGLNIKSHNMSPTNQSEMMIKESQREMFRNQMETVRHIVGEQTSASQSPKISPIVSIAASPKITDKIDDAMYNVVSTNVLSTLKSEQES